MIYTDPVSDLPSIDDGTGVKRVLARLPGDISQTDYKLLADVVPIMPREEWRDIDRREQFGPKMILDQKSHGSCVGFACAGLLARALMLRGYTGEGGKPLRLSGSYPYSKINGGRDQGAVIGDSIKCAEEGICLEEFNGWDRIYPSQISPEARQDATKRRASEIYKVRNFDEICTAIQLGFIVEFPIMVGNNFMSLDGDGVCGFTRGPGNHAIHADGMKLINSARGWTLDFPNSWNLTFGEQGRARCTQKHVDGTMEQYPDAYAIRAAEAVDPDGPPPITQ